MYTVPAGMVAIVRDADFIQDTASQNVSMAINGTYFFNDAAPATLPAGGAPIPWRGRQVLVAGDVLTVHVNGEASFSVSGYLLTAT